MSRLIDVSALKEWVENWFTKNRLYHPCARNNNIPITELYDILEQIPNVEPEPKWIPCSKTTDIPDHEIMACDKYGEIMFGYLAYEDDQWICESDGYEMVDPIAWREKPEPYREEGD